MRQTIPASWQTKLRSDDLGTVYEIVRITDPVAGTAGELASGIDSFRPRTLGGAIERATGAYTGGTGGPKTAGIVSRGSIVHRSNGSVSMRITLDNSQGGLPDWQKFAGADVQYALAAPGTDDEVPMFRGAVTSVEGDESEIRIDCVSYESALNVVVPKRKTQVKCPLKFRGADCGYVSSTLVDGGTTGTVVTCDDTTNLAADRYVISNAAANPVPVKIVSIDSGTQFTVADSTTWVDNDNIPLADCRKHRFDCIIRGRMHAYQGFPGVAQFIDAPAPPVPWGHLTEPVFIELFEGHWLQTNWDQLDPSVPGLIRAYLNAFVPDTAVGESGFARTLQEAVVPIIYGRGIVKSPRIEEHLIRLDASDGLGERDWAVGVYLIGEGELEAFHRAYDSTQNLPFFANPAGTKVTFELYWRAGTAGIATVYNVAAWVAARKPSSKVPAVIIATNGVDFRTSSSVSYSQSSILTVLVPLGQTQDTNDVMAADVLPDLFAEVSGLKIQAYTSVGAPDGATAALDVGPWILKDVLLNTRYGAGLPSDIINDATWKTSADRCTATISNTSTKFTMGPTMAAPLRIFPVGKGVAGIIPGMSFVYNTVTYNVDRVDAGRGIVVLAEGETIQVTLGDVVSYTRPRFTTNVVLAKAIKSKKVTDEILASFNGRLYYDGYELALMSEQGIWGGDAGITANVTTHRLGTIPGTFKLIRRRTSLDLKNVVVSAYSRGAGATGTKTSIVMVDADAGGLAVPQEMKLSVLATNTPDQALRNTMAQYARVQPLSNADGNNQYSASGFELETGPGGIELHIGDFYETTEAITKEDGTTRNVRVRGRVTGLNVRPDLRVKISCSPERHLMREEGFGGAIDLFGDDPEMEYEDPTAIDDPGITIAANRVDRGSAVIDITLTADNGTTGISRSRDLGRIDLHASLTSGFTPNQGAIGNMDTRVASFNPNQRQVTWNIPDALIQAQDLIYIVAEWVSLRFPESTLSNETSINALREDITGDQWTRADNMLFDGDFNDADRWANTAGSPVASRPDLNVADSGSDQGWTNATNANDTDLATEAEGAYSNDGVGGTVQSGHEWYFSPNVTVKDAFFSVTARIVHTTFGARAITGWLELYYSSDGGVKWTQFATINGLEKSTYSSNIFQGAEGDARMKAVSVFAGGVGANAGTAYISNIYYNVIAGPPYSSVNDGLGYLLGDGVNYAELRTPFPGQDPDAGRQILEITDYAVGQLMAKTESGTPTHDLEMFIDDPVGGGNWPIMTIPAAQMASLWQTGGYANRFQPLTRISGGLELVIRTKSTVGIFVDKAHVHVGSKIVGFGPRATERFVADTRVLRGRFPVGDWSTGLKRTI